MIKKTIILLSILIFISGNMFSQSEYLDFLKKSDYVINKHYDTIKNIQNLTKGSWFGKLRWKKDEKKYSLRKKHSRVACLSGVIYEAGKLNNRTWRWFRREGYSGHYDYYYLDGDAGGQSDGMGGMRSQGSTWEVHCKKKPNTEPPVFKPD